MVFYNKVKWVLGILMVFILIIATNLIDRNNFSRVKDSVVAIYKDRLIAKDLIFKMSNSVQEKELAVVASDSVFFSNRNKKVSQDIQDFVKLFEQTNLTLQEKKIFSDYKNNLEILKSSETNFIQSKFTDKTPLINHISSVKLNLNDLSKIQLDEGKRQMFLSEKAIDSVELFTKIEIYILIFLAILIQVIVIYKPKEN
ncbi:MCP four helix bundle domain-containing protein [Polaribacter sp. L3A8]|uniref:MCP four helix bundle domain-containing protein n=1 Tax=Polaribacter sp. L3A8 TaxID=2686361 RepID=UPI00131D991E|nr:MCP four helix bundle domain-containing protein [Polaribacter sp. L3A8]